MTGVLILYISQLIGLLKFMSGCGVVLGLIWYGAIRSKIFEETRQYRYQLKASLLFIAMCFILLVLIPMPEVTVQILYYIFG